VSGGGFIVSLKDAAAAMRAHVASAGFAVASVEYRTVVHGATYVDAVADVKEAIRFLRAHPTRYGIDPRRVAVWGESAGGYLAAMVGVTADRPEFDTGAHPEESSSVDAVVDLFGASDLSRIAEDLDVDVQAHYQSPDNHIAAFLGAAGSQLSDVPDLVDAANPMTYIRGHEPAFLLFHGSEDTLISPSQTLMLHEAVRAAGGTSTRLILRSGHGDLEFVGDATTRALWSTTAVADAITSFLHDRLAEPAHFTAPRFGSPGTR
jgi:acetyl esterase/lipase